MKEEFIFLKMVTGFLGKSTTNLKEKKKDNVLQIGGLQIYLGVINQQTMNSQLCLG